LLLLYLTIAESGCTSRSFTGSPISQRGIPCDVQLFKLQEKFNPWRLDTMGCRGVRKRLLNEIDSSLKGLISSDCATTSAIISIFGNPEFSYTLPYGELYFCYFYGNRCEFIKDGCDGDK